MIDILGTMLIWCVDEVMIITFLIIVAGKGGFKTFTP